MKPGKPLLRPPYVTKPHIVATCPLCQAALESLAHDACIREQEALEADDYPYDTWAEYRGER